MNRPVVTCVGEVTEQLRASPLLVAAAVRSGGAGSGPRHTPVQQAVLEAVRQTGQLDIDRLAEASAEALHAKVRQEDWGYAPMEQLSNTDLIAEKYTGIRPAPGYPACPDHLDKPTIWKMLEVEQRLGMQLTESLAMTPAASVSGFMLSHPQSQYFNVGKIGEDQLRDLATRRGEQAEVLQRLLAPNL